LATRKAQTERKIIIYLYLINLHLSLKEYPSAHRQSVSAFLYNSHKNEFLVDKWRRKSVTLLVSLF
jgi:hypothetical protein